VAFRDILSGITIPNILKRIVLADNACRALGIRHPRIGVAALNPHASDGGLFGDEEESIIIPAISLAQEKGIITSERPIPADVIFAQCLGAKYDAVVAMYHDQGHIPVKTVGFRWHDGGWEKMDGVNVTLGLPIIRTSPDHGVAFGKAGKGDADPTSMIAAIKLAVTLVESRKNNGRN
jgi:4-hydroxy-L-threonine phosphate dehydrogenase PdxA